MGGAAFRLAEEPWAVTDVSMGNSTHTHTRVCVWIKFVALKVQRPFVSAPLGIDGAAALGSVVAKACVRSELPYLAVVRFSLRNSPGGTGMNSFP